MTAREDAPKTLLEEKANVKVKRKRKLWCRDPFRHGESYLDAGYPDPCVSECGNHGVIACAECLGPPRNWLEEKDAITFYRSVGSYGFLSNLFPCKVVFDGREVASSEHAYQAAKSSKREIADWIAAAPHPRCAALAAHNLFPYDVRPDWPDVKLDVMTRVVRAKFEQNEDLRKLLLATENRVIAEASKSDGFWGCGERGTGYNMLGIILMEVRDRLRERRPECMSPPVFTTGVKVEVREADPTHWHRIGSTVQQCRATEPQFDGYCPSLAGKVFATEAHARGECIVETCADCQVGAPAQERAKEVVLF